MKTAIGLPRYLVLTAGTAVAVALLVAFYSVVAGAVGRASAGREVARVALERRIVCSAFSTESSRDLCQLTVAARAAVPAKSEVVRVSTEAPAWSAEQPVASARVY